LGGDQHGPIAALGPATTFTVHAKVLHDVLALGAEPLHQVLGTCAPAPSRQYTGRVIDPPPHRALHEP